MVWLRRAAVEHEIAADSEESRERCGSGVARECAPGSEPFAGKPAPTGVRPYRVEPYILHSPT